MRPITPGARGYVGGELDLTAYWQAMRSLDVQMGYSHFFAGSYLRDSGSADDANFVYLMTTFKF